MKLSKWHIDLMREAFGIELTQDDKEMMVLEVLKRFPRMRDVIVTKKRIEFKYEGTAH